MVVEALKLFFSYSHKDEALRNELGNHLKILEHQKLIASWHDRKISAGDEWNHQITVNQDTADIILLLISSDFIASKYCWDIEIKRAMELHESGKACVVPVILRRADWTNAPFSKLQAVPKNAQPVTSFADRDEAFHFITQQIRQVAESLIERRKNLQEQQQKDNAIATYRQQFEAFAADGEISFGEQFVLDELQQKLGLTDADVQVIKRSILQLVADPQQVERYRQFFVKAIAQHGYPFNDKVRNDLKLVQTHLNLSDTDIAKVEAPIIAQKQEEQKKQQRQAEALKQQQSLGQPSATDLKHKPVAQTVISDDISLESERGVNYTRLRDLLKAGKWKDADQETNAQMLNAIGKEFWGNVENTDLSNFPCEDLKTIDRLWMKYSNGHFGFSVQKKIYVECGASLDGTYPDSKIWGRFCDRVGWRVKGYYVNYDSLKFDPSFSFKGELPVTLQSKSMFRQFGSCNVDLFWRTQVCNF